MKNMDEEFLIWLDQPLDSIGQQSVLHVRRRDMSFYRGKT